MKNPTTIYLALLSFLFSNGFAQSENIKNTESLTTELKMEAPVDYSTIAQRRFLKKPNKLYENYSYADAVVAYEKAYKKGNKSPELFKKLGNAYYVNANMEKASYWYEKLFALEIAVEPEYYIRYAQTLKSTGEYEKANSLIVRFHEVADTDSRGEKFMKSSNYLDIIKTNSGRYELKDAGINSKYVDYGAAVIGNKLVFTSARDTGNFAQRKHEWSHQYFTSLYTAAVSLENPAKIKVVKYARNLNSKFHESTPVFSADGKTMYFTRNNYLRGKRGKNANRITLLKIYQAKWIDSSWQAVTELPINDNNYSTEHPALSPDGKTLYFASDRPGSYGQLDLWRASINDDGSFGNPENLGSNINTEGRESFPSFTKDNELYFASDGLMGLGGYDIFVSKLSKNKVFQDPINVGTPANSGQDDFAYYIDTNTRIGYLSSNRPGGQGLDDIYQFIETKPLFCDQILLGAVTDADTKKYIPSAIITIRDDQQTKIQEIETDSNGAYSIEVICGKTYRINIEKEGYISKEEQVSILDKSGKTILNVELEKVVVQGDDLAIKLELNNIYFDFDKFNIRKNAAIELRKLADYLQINTAVQISIRSHTDCRNTHKYNQVLSERRAKSTFNWLVKNGIEAWRLDYQGFGESQLVNGCHDNVHCSAAEHQLNRRSEFIITKM
jgi:outer membrane protein OmpA-like peptidoglycan-associated protein